GSIHSKEALRAKVLGSKYAASVDYIPTIKKLKSESPMWKEYKSFVEIYTGFLEMEYRGLVSAKIPTSDAS
ncbi:hypothetical protein SESBI_42836, partial [Sesbania bispinosa]